MTECNSDLPFNFYSQRPLVVQLSDLELSADAGILLARQAEVQTIGGFETRRLPLKFFAFRGKP